MSSETRTLANSARWGTQPNISIAALSCPENLIEVKLPKHKYQVMGMQRDIESEVIATFFFVGKHVDGTPRQALMRYRRNLPMVGELCSYEEGKNRWMLSTEICFLNGKVAFLVLPNDVKEFLITTELLCCSSRMAKIVKDIVIPELLVTKPDLTVKIVKPDIFTVSKTPVPRKLVTNDEIEDLLIKNIDNMF